MAITGANARIEINGDVIDGLNATSLPSPAREQYDQREYEKAVKKVSGNVNWGSASFNGNFESDSTAQVSIRTLFDNDTEVTSWKIYPDIVGSPSLYLGPDTVSDPETCIKISAVDRMTINENGLVTWGFDVQFNGPWKWNGR